MSLNEMNAGIRRERVEGAEASAAASGARSDRAHPFAHLEGDLGLLSALGRHRKLERGAGLDLASNDYLGLANSLALREAAMDAVNRGVPTGAGGSRLLRGNHEEHEALEEEAARFFHAEAALYFPTGFAANAALIATLPRGGDLLVHDEFIHASI